MKVKKYFLIFACSMVCVIALLYGISPSWFAQTFLGKPGLDANFTHILRAMMCLYLGFGIFWLYSAFSDRYRNFAVLTTMVFAGGLVTGRIISLAADGRPALLLVVYMALEFTMIPLAYWVWKQPV